MSSDNDETASIRCGTTQGDIVLELYRHWSPHGYDRAVQLFDAGFFDNTHFFRTVPGFLVQFGITYAGDEIAKLGKKTIPDDPQLDPRIPFTEGTISYAGSGANSRTSQMFISLMKKGGNFGQNPWETPIGQIVEGMDHVKQFYGGYGDMPPWGQGPLQGKIIQQGAKYMEENFPKTDRFRSCKVERRKGSSFTQKEARIQENVEAQGMSGQLRHHAVPMDDHAKTSLPWSHPGGVAVVLFLGSLLIMCVQLKLQKQRKAREKHSV